MDMTYPSTLYYIDFYDIVIYLIIKFLTSPGYKFTGFLSIIVKVDGYTDAIDLQIIKRKLWGCSTGADLSVTRYFLRIGSNVYRVS